MSEGVTNVDDFRDEHSAKDEVAFLMAALFFMFLASVAVLEYVKWAYR